jgi:hypothetical protein
MRPAPSRRLRFLPRQPLPGGYALNRLVVLLCLAAWLAAGSRPAVADPVVINFDQDANGNPINAPPDFIGTTRLSTLYSSLGVTFSGPGGNDGGAILNQNSNFGVSPVSGPNFLAFNPFAKLSDGGVPQGPETISFANPVSTVSIQVAGGIHADPFLLQAFDGSNQLVDSSSVTTQQFAPLTVSSPGGISSVVLSTTGNGVFVADDLSFTASPEPTSLALFGLTTLAGASYLGWRRRAGTPRQDADEPHGPSSR